MKGVRLLVCGLLASIVLTSTALAQGVWGLRTGYVSFGTGVGLSGNVIHEATGTVGGRPTVLVEQAFSNHFSDGFRFKLGGSYGIAETREVFASFAYGRLNATERIVGSISGYPLYGRFSTARTIDFEGGLRYYFLPDGPLRTYVAGTLGIRFLDEVSATFRVPEVGFTAADVPYFDGSTLFLFGGDAGIMRDINERVAIGGEMGLRFQPKPGPADLELGPGLEAINDTGSRWSIPLNVFVAVRF